MKKLAYLILSVFLFLNVNTHGQSTCSFDEQLARYKQQDPIAYSMSRAAQVAAVQRYRATHTGVNHYPNNNPTGNSNALMGGSCDSAKCLLPVVVHIIHLPSHTSPGTGSNISDAQVQNQLDELNKAYGNYYMPHGDSAINTGIRFCLAQTKPDGTSFSGISRIASTNSNHFRWHKDSLRALIHYPTNQYINIYVVNDIFDSSGTSSGVLGYANFPFGGSRVNDMVTYRHDWFGKYSSSFPVLNTLSEGKGLAHEMGHYLGLYHPFSDGCIGLNANDCATSGDLCCDVPAVSSIVIGGCNGANSCFENYNGNPPDQKENYMDYSDPSCKNTFTADQAEVMYTTLEGVRASLWQPTNVNALDLACCINSAQFTGYTDGCSIDSIFLTGYDYTGTTSYTWNLYKNGSLYKTQTTSSSTYGELLDSGTYDIQLIVTTGGNTFSKQVDDAMRIHKCDSLLPSTQGSWYFGRQAGLTFYENGLVLKDNGPSFNPLPTQINSQQATIGMCDSTGDLLYYGGVGITEDSIRLFDSDYKEMEGSPNNRG